MNHRKKVNLITLGCPKNIVDSEILLGSLKHENIDIVNTPQEADIVVINTCGFLDSAREESIETILEVAELKNSSELKELVVMGCFSERYSGELQQEIPEVDKFFGTNNHSDIVSFLTGKEYLKYDPQYFRSLLTPSHYAYLKIAEGCDNGCSFCSIPLMRGLQKSLPIDELVAEAESLANLGVKELIIIAQDSTSYGWDLRPKAYLHDLLTELDRIDGFQWIRVLYGHPAHLSTKVINVMAKSEKICHYLDLPVQHASDKLLKSMRRGLGKDGIIKQIEHIRSRIPDIALRTSLIVGYPGETEEDFQELMDFVEEIRFERLGVFTYSAEEGTLAYELNDDVPEEVKWERRDKIMTLQQDISLENNSKLIGKKIEVLIEKVEDSVSIGRTQYDAPEIDNTVKIPGKLEIGNFYVAKVIDCNEYELECSV